MLIRNLTRETILAERGALGVTFALKLRGLMFRRTFGPFDGLWLAPTNAIHMFWVRFPIDLVWLDDRLIVVATTAALAPWRLASCRDARSVIELPAGTLARTDTRPGDRIGIGG